MYEPKSLDEVDKILSSLSHGDFFLMERSRNQITVSRYYGHTRETDFDRSYLKLEPGDFGFLNINHGSLSRSNFTYEREIDGVLKVIAGEEEIDNKFRELSLPKLRDVLDKLD